MEIELLLDAHATIGEAPTWVPPEGALYWIDVKEPALHRLELSTRASRTWRLPSDVGAFALGPGPNEAVVALRTGVHRLDLQTGTLAQLAPPPFDPALHRFNEGACDSAGRLWVGTMFDPTGPAQPPPEPAPLFSFTLSGGLRLEPDAAELHNGMAWSADEETFFLSHSQKRQVYAFPFHVADGVRGAPRTFVTVPDGIGIPDGAAMDAEGCYWCALHGGSRLRRYRADGVLDREVMLPVSQPTMCAFAGPALDLMVVTSAADQLTPQQRSEEPNAGGLFCFDPGVRGIERHYRVR